MDRTWHGLTTDVGSLALVAPMGSWWLMSAHGIARSVSPATSWGCESAW